jgi:hypothetical protein
LDRPWPLGGRRKAGEKSAATIDHVPVEPAEALNRMRESAAFWSVRKADATELIDAACELLVTGHAGTHLAMLAGVHSRNADEEVPELLQAALHDVGLDFPERDSDAGKEAGLRIMAGRVIAGVMPPIDLASWAHATVGHGVLDLAERLVELDDVYEILDYSDMTEEAFDAEVIAEARRIADGGSHRL